MLNTPLKFLAIRRVRRSLIVAAIFMVLWLLSSAAVLYALTRRHGPRTEEPVPKLNGLKLETHRLSTSDGEQLGAWFVEGRSDGPSVLVLHGHRGRRWNSLRRAKLLAEHGCSVLMISLRAHGDSTGEFDDAGFSARHDVCAAVAFLERRRPGQPILVNGNSMGAAAAIFAAGELGDRVAGYILESPYQNLKVAVWNRIDRWLPRGLSHAAYGGMLFVSPLFLPRLDEISPASAIGAIPDDVPVLILAGAVDRLARPEEARVLHEIIAAHSRLLCIPGAGHGDLLGSAPGQYSRAVLEFLEAAARPGSVELMPLGSGVAE
jgi:pimeloyl-ACP methyl ester carboxylesterase